MSERSTEIAPRKDRSGLPATPQWMNVEDDHSIDDLKQYVRPPRVKVVQALSDTELVDAFGVGSVVLLPQGSPVMEMKFDEKARPCLDQVEPMLFTPLFFFAEFVCWNPLALKGTVPAIRERSFDPNSDIAKKAQNPNLRTEVYPEDPSHEIQYCEHLNFVVAIEGVDDPCVLSFARAEFSMGQKFASMAKMRAQRGCPLYGGVYAAYIGHRVNNKGNWYGLDIANPPEDVSPFVDEAVFEQYKALHEELKQQHADALIRVDYEDESVNTSPSEAADSI